LDPRKGTKGRPEEASSWLAGAKWHEEVDVNKHDKAEEEEEEWGIGRYGKLLSGG